MNLPYMNIRMRVVDNVYFVDFYHEVMANSYVDDFLAGWQQVKRQARYKADLTPSSTPFYFTRCPQCSFEILTNRDVGYGMECKWCSGRHATEAIEKRQLNQILESINDKLGLSVIDLAGMLIVLLIQPEEPLQLKTIREICQREGFEELSETAPAAGNLIMEAFDRGVIEFGRQRTFWQRYCETGETGYSDQTPPRLQSLIARLREDIGEFQSMSTSYLPEDQKMLGLGKYAAELETNLRRQVLEAPYEVANFHALVQFLISQGKYEEARHWADAATKVAPRDPLSWESLGQALSRLSRPEKAIEPLQRALELDPVSTSAMLILVHCYQEIGDEARAQALVARMRSLGLNI